MNCFGSRVMNTAERFRWYGATGETGAPSSPEATMERPMPRPNDSHRSLLPLEQESTLIAVVELSRSSWLVPGSVPGVERHPLKKLDPDEDALLRLLRRLGLLRRWRDDAAGAGRTITRL